MVEYTDYLSFKINEEKILEIKDLIPTDLVSLTKDEIYNYIYTDLNNNIDKIYSTDNYIKLFTNKYILKSKYDFFQFFNTINDNILYKLINFYYVIYNNYNRTIQNKQYNNYYINWDCNYKNNNNGYIQSYELSDLYLDYTKNSNNNNIEYNFYKILNISLKIWEDFYLVYLNKCKKCDLSNNSFYNNIIIDSVKDTNINLDNFFDKNSIFNYNIFINKYSEENLLNNKKITISNNINNDNKVIEKNEKYILIFQYIEVKDNDIFEFNFNFLNKYNNYPDTLFKEYNKKLIYN